MLNIRIGIESIGYSTLPSLEYSGVMEMLHVVDMSAGISTHII